MPSDPLPALASAAEGSRELDALVAEAAGWKQARNGLWHHAEDVSEARRCKVGMLNYRPRPLPAFTTSVDAALTLVPEGWSCLLAFGPNGAVCDIHTKPLGDPAGFWPGHATAATPAIAIVLAALRAREAAP